MELDHRVTTGDADQDTISQIRLVELAAENARLRQLVGELLFKNQRLREAGTNEDFVSAGN